MSDQFEPRSARRIAEAVRRLARIPRNEVERPVGPQVYLGARMALTTSAIGARSGTPPGFTYGKGTATLLGVSVDGSRVATSFDGGTDATIYHAGTTSIPSGTLVQVKWIGPILVVDTRYC